MRHEESSEESRAPVPILVVDVNVFASAAITGRGPTLQLIEAATAGAVTIVVSPLLLDELRKILKRDKFRRYITLDEVDEFVAAVELLARIVDDPPSVGLIPVCRDPKDDYLVYLAEDVEATLLVSGDKDLRSLERPGLDVRTPAQTIEALAYRHAWGPGLIPASSDKARRQAEAEGHSSVLKTASAFMMVFEEANSADILPFIVTPESLSSWLSQVDVVTEMLRGRGMTSRGDYPLSNVALVKLPPDPEATLKATGPVELPANTVVLILQRRPELPDVGGLGGWRVHALMERYPTASDLDDLFP